VKKHVVDLLLGMLIGIAMTSAFSVFGLAVLWLSYGTVEFSAWLDFSPFPPPLHKWGN
jgi:hypothetical protein